MTGKEIRELMRVNGVELSRVANTMGKSENTIHRALRRDIIRDNAINEYLKGIELAKVEKVKELRAEADTLDSALIGYGDGEVMEYVERYNAQKGV